MPTSSITAPTRRPAARVVAAGRSVTLVVAAVVLVAAVACQPEPGAGSRASRPRGAATREPARAARPGVSGVDYYGNLLYGHDVDQNQDLLLDAYVPTR